MFCLRSIMDLHSYAALAACLFITSCTAVDVPVRSVPPERSAQFDRFEPAPSPGTTRSIDYTIVDEFLAGYVLDTGPSLRSRNGRSAQITGTRISHGHNSPYRLEGNRVLFSEFSPTTKLVVSEQVDSLIEIANNHNLTKLPKNEQLSYWLNLHNLVVIREIAERYPTRFPSRTTSDESGLQLHDAPIVTVNGVTMSLRDIRENIVYRYWTDPVVFYGFFRGDVASPNIRRSTYKGSSVSAALNDNAVEFVGSLRGVSATFGPTVVSPLYREVRASYGLGATEEFRSFLLRHANDEVAPIIVSARDFGFAKRELTVADLVGGTVGPVIEPSVLLGPGIPYQQLAFLQGLRRKQEILRERLRESDTKVTIEDVTTQDVVTVVQ